MQKNQGFKKAFTVLELIFVMIILGILAAIALPKLSSSKDEAELSKALNNLKTMISDISTYALKNSALSSTSLMSGVDGLENVDLSTLNGVREVKFKVANDENCISVLFISLSNVLIMGLASNDNTKTLIQNIAQAQNEALKNNSVSQNYNNALKALLNADFTSTSTDKVCVNLSTHSNFKALANRTYTLLGG